MPLTLPAWATAMKTVDRSQPSRPNAEVWGYWIPEPSLLVGPKANSRIERYLMNWLRIRDAWIYLLALPDSPVTRVSAQWWRDYCNGDTAEATPQNNSRRAKRLEAVKSVFVRAFTMEDYAPAAEERVRWFDFRLRALDHALAPLVLWELFELGFRHELLALDRILVPMRDTPNADVVREALLSPVFARHDLYRLKQFPTAPEGLCAITPELRTQCLEALRRVFLRWPGCPEELVNAPEITRSLTTKAIEDLELTIASFYCTMFFAYSGRAPLIPHALPHRSHTT